MSLIHSLTNEGSGAFSASPSSPAGRFEPGEQRRGQFLLTRAHRRLRGNLRGVIQRDPGDAEQEHRDETDRRAHPVPLVEMLQPERSALLG